MRELYVVPVIHTSADLGTLAPAINSGSRERLGEDVWLKHKETVTGFWNAVAGFIGSLPVVRFKVYQDGLVADGELGMRIVEQGVKDGSKNYEIISELIEKGAELVKTEDLALVRREYDLLTKVVKANSTAARVSAAMEFRSTAKELLYRRDTFIAQRIGDTLHNGETGVLFIGAYHDVVLRLPHDILVQEVKDTMQVREYHVLLSDRRRSKKRFEELEHYLVEAPTLD